VRILDNLFNPHLNHLQRAMTKTSQRHSLLGANLANVNTPGYKRRDLDFSIQLDSELSRRNPRMEQWRQNNAMRNQSGGSLRPDGNNVDLEQEVMSIAETELRYQALTDMTNRYFTGLRNVIREGK
jgi:flagellar basal-body rod protein FlgB